MVVSQSPREPRLGLNSQKVTGSVLPAGDLPTSSADLLQWYDSDPRPHPWRIAWQTSQDVYAVWVSEIMLQQTTLASMIPIYERFMKRYPGVEDLALADPEELRSAVRGLGYYSRFARMQAAAQELIGRKSGWPKSSDEWLSLPGIGPYTSAAIASICLDEAIPVVDGNVERVTSRLLDYRGPISAIKKHLPQWIGSWISLERPGDFNQALMELGQRVCRPLKPSCGECPLQSDCLAFARDSQQLCPAKKPRKTFIQVDLHLEIPIRGGCVGLIRRGETSQFLKGTLGFPLWNQGQPIGHDLRALSNWQPFAQVKHSITKYKIQLHVGVSGRSNKAMKWVPREEIEERLVSNLDRKAWNSYLQSLH